jgi:peptidyl-prolyl cis-trans isomerase C
MKKITKSLILICAAAPLVIFGATPDQAKTNSTSAKALDALFADSVVAKGKGVEVKRSELDSELTSTKAMLAAQGRQGPPDLEQQALKSLIVKQLLLNKAGPEDRAKGKEEFLNKLTMLKTNNNLSDEDFDQKISHQLFGGQTREQWNQQNIETATIPIVLQREMKINLSNEDLKKFYDAPENVANFEQPEMVRASHILLLTKNPETNEPLSDDKKAAKHKQMEDILKQAKAGTNFAELAKKYSEDPGSKDKGGEYTFPKGQMDPAFEAAAWALNTNQISDIITTDYGYHIIKLSEKIPAKKVEFDKVKDEIKDFLLQQGIRKGFPAYANNLIKDANVQILDEKLKGTDLSFELPKAADEVAAPVKP